MMYLFPVPDRLYNKRKPVHWEKLVKIKLYFCLLLTSDGGKASTEKDQRVIGHLCFFELLPNNMDLFEFQTYGRLLAYCSSETGTVYMVMRLSVPCAEKSVTIKL